MAEGAAFGRKLIRLRRIRKKKKKKKKKKKNCFQVKKGSRSFRHRGDVLAIERLSDGQGDGMNRAEPGLGVGRKDRPGRMGLPTD